MFRFIAAFAICFALSGCSGGSAPVTPPPATPTPAPAPVMLMPPRRGRQVFAADWSGPGINCYYDINGDVPPKDNTPPHAIWGTTDFHAGQTLPLCQDGPNSLYSADGKLHLKALGTAFPIITKKTFPRTGITSFRGEFTCDTIHADSGWGGLVAYNGDAKGWVADEQEMLQLMQDTGQWWGIYFSWRNGHLVASVWSASTIMEQQSVRVIFGCPYTFRIDMDNDNRIVEFWIADARGAVVMYLTTSTFEPINRDPVLFTHDPHLAVFLGDLDLTVGPLDVFSEA